MKRTTANDFPALGPYPAVTRHFVRLGRGMQPYWHSLFDHCPELLKLDPPEGMQIFRGFIKAAQRQGLPLDWTLYVNLYRWLQGSAFKAALREEHLEGLLLAAAACWSASDTEPQTEILMAHQQLPNCWIQAVKASATANSALEVLNVAARWQTPRWDFAYCLGSNGVEGQPSAWQRLAPIRPEPTKIWR